VAAANLLSLEAFCSGREGRGVGYLRSAIRMGSCMGLFGVASGTSSARSWLNNYEDWIRAASQTAWGSFVWARSALLFPFF
jgi:hypothetical protein